MNFSEDAQKKTSAFKLWLAFAVALIALAVAGYRLFLGDLAKPVATAPLSTAANPGQAASSKPLTALSDEQLERMVVQAMAQTKCGLSVRQHTKRWCGNE